MASKPEDIEAIAILLYEQDMLASIKRIRIPWHELDKFERQKYRMYAIQMLDEGK